MCNDGIMLEPRLMEYMNKKQYYASNDIDPPVSLEQQFSITDKDMRVIRKFASGDREIYGKKKKSKPDKITAHYIRSREKENKRRSGKNVKTPVNRGMFYDPEGKTYDNVPQTNDSRINNMLSFWDEQKLGYQIDDNDARGSGMNSVLSMKHVMRGDAYEGDGFYDAVDGDSRLYKVDNDHDMELNRMLFDHPDKEHTSYYMEINDHDKYNPGYSHRRTDYRPRPFSGYSDQPDPCTVHGVPTNTFKSYGYRNPAEHYFQYIDPAHTNREESVFPFPRGGDITRLGNKKMRRSYKREVM